MQFIEAIEQRRSRRKYLTTSIDYAEMEQLQELVQQYNHTGGIRIELVFNDGSAFNGFRKSYGMFSGVRNYAGLIAYKNDFQSIEKLGYYGERLTLNAVTMGLGTCWVGGSFDRSECPFTLSGDEMIICTITMGKVPEKDSVKEKLIYNITHRKTKSIEEMFISDGAVPNWFMNGMRAVQKAPSAVNRQPVLFSFNNGIVKAGIKDIYDIGSLLDLGIAKLHFELGVGRGTWNFGNDTEFQY